MNPIDDSLPHALAAHLAIGVLAALTLFGCASEDVGPAPAPARGGASSTVGAVDPSSTADSAPGPSDTGASAPAPDATAPRDTSSDVTPTPTPTPACDAADGCAMCAGSGELYASAAQCRAVVACVRAGDGGEYPWQGCHNKVVGGGGRLDGLVCLQHLVAACPL